MFHVKREVKVYRYNSIDDHIFDVKDVRFMYIVRIFYTFGTYQVCA